MLRDNLPSYQLPGPNDLSVAANHEVDLIINFIDRHISTFREYYHLVKDGIRENRISDILINHFQLCKNEQGGFFPYDFRKNPSQPDSTKESDIGVFVMTRDAKPLPIVEFEAKRFSESSNNKEYVSGERGGIERFKRGHHSKHLSICGMFAYVQSRTCSEWFTKINGWIDDLSKNNKDDDINWTDKEERLTQVTSFPNVEKFSSKHHRKRSNDQISLWHYFINLV